MRLLTKLYVVVALLISISILPAQTQLSGNVTISGIVTLASTYGCVGDGTTDNSTCVNNALSYLAANGGGTLFFGPGTFRVDSQVTIPYTAAATGWCDATHHGVRPCQRNIRITGSGGGSNWWDSNATSLDLRYAGGDPKLISLGCGALEIDNITLEDLGTANSSTFLLVTNTVLSAHDATFIGSSKSTYPYQDAIQLGGTSGAVGPGLNDGFQGYGTVINQVHFRYLQRAVYALSFANGVVFTNNAIYKPMGTRAIEFDGSSGGLNDAPTITGNTIQVNQNLLYGIYFKSTRTSSMSGNAFWDAGSQFLAGYFLDTNAYGNTIGLGYGPVGHGVRVGGDATSLATTTIVGAQGALDTTGRGTAGSEFAYGMVVKGVYDSTKAYPGQLTIADLFTPAEHLTLGYDYVGNRGLIDAYQAAVGPKPLVLNPSGGAIIFGTTATPASSSAACVAGTVAWDASYVYVCISTNTWMRAAIITW